VTPPRQRGFSLLEVIAAIAILGIAFAALMQVAGSSMRLAANAAERTEASLRARSLLDGAFAMEPLKPGDTSGSFDNRYAWHLVVSPWQPADQPAADNGPRLFRLDLTVSWGARSAQFSTLRLAPAANTP
jgi:general secretion pathway protein I